MKKHFFFPACILLASFLFSCTIEKERVSPFENGHWIDLTHDFSEETLYWPTSETFSIDTVFVGYTDAGFYYESFSICTAEHGGTHLDAPIHFFEGRQTTDQIPLENLTGFAAVIDVSEQAEENRDYEFLTDDILAWEDEHDTTIDGHIVIFRTGFHRFWPNAEEYMGTSKRGEEGVAELSFPGIHPETARWIVENREIKAVGLDTPSLDFGKSTLFEAHQILFEQNIPGFENVANLDELPTSGAYIVALPMKIKDGSGAPLRIAAFIESE